MQRAIVSFDADTEGAPIAWLTCGHPQHVRHVPPFQSRPWVLDAASRATMLGQTLNCVRCDRLELPGRFVAYKQTPVFTEQTIPAGLLRNHSTKVGVWGRIVVLQGRLHYRCESLAIDDELSAAHGGVVVPEVPHSVAPHGAVRFFVEFYRAPGDGG